MKKPLLTKIEAEYIALLRLYRHQTQTPVNTLINKAVAEYLAKLYLIDELRLNGRAHHYDASQFLSK